MPGSKINDVYTDITYTRYPSQIDSRDNPPADVVEKGTATLLIPAAEQMYNSDIVENINNTDYAMAEDVNVLQDQMLTVQRSLGIMPQGTFASVKARIESIESKDFDARYIYGVEPSEWAYNISSDTIYTHKHNSDGINGPSKIDLAAEVQGLLQKQNIKLEDSGALMGEDIWMSPTDNRKVKDAIDAQFPRSAGSSYPITGDLYLQQRFYGGLYAEWDAQAFTANKISDADAYSQFAARLTTGWCIVGPDAGVGYTKLRYGKFVVCFRMKVINPPADGAAIAAVAAGPVLNGSDPNFAIKYLYSGDFETPGQYEMIYMTFNHKRSATYGNSFKFYIYSYNKCTVDVDSVIVTPTHTSVYDD